MPRIFQLPLQKGKFVCPADDDPQLRQCGGLPDIIGHAALHQIHRRGSAVIIRHYDQGYAQRANLIEIPKLLLEWVSGAIEIEDHNVAQSVGDDLLDPVHASFVHEREITPQRRPKEHLQVWIVRIKQQTDHQSLVLNIEALSLISALCVEHLSLVLNKVQFPLA